MKRSPGSQLEYFVAAIACIAPVLFLLGPMFYLTRAPLSAILFGSAQFARLMLPLFLLLLGGAAQVIVYGFYRGCLSMKRAGAMQICVATVPILSAVVLFRTQSVVLIVSMMGCSVFAVAFAFAIPLLRALLQIRVANITSRAVELLRYGASRVPGDLSCGALLAVGPVLAAHYVPVSRVSYLLVATSLLTAASVSTEPLGLVFLSKISMMLAHDRLSEVNIYLSYLVSATLQLSLFLTIQLVVFADVLIRALIGHSFLEGILVIRIVLLSIPSYLYYTALRSVVDAGSIRPLNARNVAMSLGALLFLIVLVIKTAPREFLLHAIAIALVISLSLLAYSTSLSLRRLYRVRVHWKESFLPLCNAILLGAIGLAYHRIASGSLLELAGLQLGFGLLFLGMCYYSEASWVRFLWTTVFRLKSVAETATT
jgi:O-antigen/teichoic acid export membrane protein